MSVEWEEVGAKMIIQETSVVIWRRGERLGYARSNGSNRDPSQGNPLIGRVSKEQKFSSEKSSFKKTAARPEVISLTSS